MCSSTLRSGAASIRLRPRSTGALADDEFSRPVAMQSVVQEARCSMPRIDRARCQPPPSMHRRFGSGSVQPSTRPCKVSPRTSFSMPRIGTALCLLTVSTCRSLGRQWDQPPARPYEVPPSTSHSMPRIGAAGRLIADSKRRSFGRKWVWPLTGPRQASSRRGFSISQRGSPTRSCAIPTRQNFLDERLSKPGRHRPGLRRRLPRAARRSMLRWPFPTTFPTALNSLRTQCSPSWAGGSCQMQRSERRTMTFAVNATQPCWGREGPTMFSSSTTLAFGRWVKLRQRHRGALRLISTALLNRWLISVHPHPSNCVTMLILRHSRRVDRHLRGCTGSSPDPAASRHGNVRWPRLAPRPPRGLARHHRHPPKPRPKCRAGMRQ